MSDQKNTLIAILLSAVVLIVWQYFVGIPQAEKQRQEAAQRAPQQQTQTAPGATATPQQGTVPQPGATAPGQPPAAPGRPGQAAPAIPGQPASRETVLAQSPRIAIDTPRLRGSIALKGARIDDLSLIQYRETVNPNSPPITLLSPSGSAHPFYAESGFVAASGSNAKLPTPDTQWRQVGAGALRVGHPVTLAWDNGEGLEFRRTVAVDENYLFTVEQKVINSGANPVTLYPYALVSRHGTPKIEGYYISHEGLIGIGERLEEYSYSAIEDKKNIDFKLADGWFGFTDKYWAATWIPEKTPDAQAHFKFFTLGNIKAYQADYLGAPKTAAAGGEVAVTHRLFAGAKEVAVIDHYQTAINADRFDRLIDWGWFYFITKPMFMLLDYFFRLVGNFGVAILIVTVIIKIIFFPLANKSYASMAKMKAVQPQMTAIRDRYADDKVKQQQALMELYKQEKINPLAGCLPIAIQIPVFFALYKVLFVTIEMRHAPFFGWIKDLSGPDPTTVFNLFGLIPWDPSTVPVLGPFLMLGVWPLIMGVTMWVQMKLNPSPPDPTQKMIFDWMPIIFTFMLASFSAGLVIYWAWNNTLSVIQQTAIMRKNGAKIELWDNLKSVFVKPKGG